MRGTGDHGSAMRLELFDEFVVDDKVRGLGYGRGSVCSVAIRGGAVIAAAVVVIIIGGAGVVQAGDDDAVGFNFEAGWDAARHAHLGVSVCIE